MTKTNFKMIRDFHTVFGLPNRDEKYLNVFDDNNDPSDKSRGNALIKLRMDLISEEVRELLEAVKQKDLVELIDALGDINYVCYGAGTSLGFDMDKEFDKYFNTILTRLLVKKREIEEIRGSFKNITNFQKMRKFGILTEKIQEDDNEILKDCFENHTDLITTSCMTIEYVLKILNNSIIEENLEKFISTLCVMIGSCYSMGSFLHVDMDYAYRLIHESNMTKFCKDEEEAQLSVKDYKDKYERNESTYDSPDYRLSDDGKHYVVFNKSNGKILKSINYKPVDLTFVTK